MLQLVAATAVAIELDDGTGRPSARETAVPARAVPAELPEPSLTGSERALEQLLGERSSALLGRDRAAFLATVDPRAQALRARQAALFDALAQVPLGSWRYVLHARSAPSARQGCPGCARWAPEVELHYGLAGFDARPVVVEQRMAFVRRSGRWFLADDEVAGRGEQTPPALWERGPVAAVRAHGVLVLGRPGHDRLLREVAALAAEALPRVTAAWGPWPEQVVVVVPDDAQELAELLGSGADVSRLAAVATAEPAESADARPTGQRVLIDPTAFAALGQLSRRVVLTHEVTHVATRQATGPAVPSWLAEGLADTVAYADVDLPLSVTAADLAREVKAGRVPVVLPTDADFDAASSPRLSEAYQGAWLAVRLLEQRHGRPALLRLYRDLGARRGTSTEGALDQALRAQLGTTTAAFTADWRTALQRQLG